MRSSLLRGSTSKAGSGPWSSSSSPLLRMTGGSWTSSNNRAFTTETKKGPLTPEERVAALNKVMASTKNVYIPRAKDRKPPSMLNPAVIAKAFNFTALPYDTHSYLHNVSPTLLSTLPNKFRVASEYRPGETATVGVWIDAGSVWEDENTNGVAHFLEHMAFKGTGNRTMEQIETEIENMGGQLNAYTSREQTVYHAHVLKKDVPKAVEILADILQNSSFRQDDIERERGVILREMVDVESQPDEVIFDHLHAIAFQGTPLGYTILGPEKNIQKIQRDDLLKYIATHYTGPRMVLVGAGAVDHDELVKLGEKHFGGLSSENKAKPREKYDFTGSMVHVLNEDIPQVHTAIGMRSVGWSNPHYFTFMMLQMLVGSWDRNLGGGKNLISRVCESFASENLARSLVSFNTCYNDTGLFGAYIIGDDKNLIWPIRTVMQEWVRLGVEASEFEVENAKRKLKSTFLMQMDGTLSAAEDIGRQVLTLGRRMSPREVFDRIQAIDYREVRRVAEHYLIDTDPAVAAVGNFDFSNFPDWHMIRGWTNYLRL